MPTKPANEPEEIGKRHPSDDELDAREAPNSEPPHAVEPVHHHVPHAPAEQSTKKPPLD